MPATREGGHGTCMTTRLMPVVLVAALALSGGGKPDWIEQALVTVDV